jgi:hypothetical protein
MKKRFQQRARIVVYIERSDRDRCVAAAGGEGRLSEWARERLMRETPKHYEFAAASNMIRPDAEYVQAADCSLGSAIASACEVPEAVTRAAARAPGRSAAPAHHPRCGCLRCGKK